MIKNVKYVLLDEDNEPIKNEDGSFYIKTAEIILENTAEVEEFNVSNLENSNQQINELQTKNTELTSQIEEQTLQLNQIEISGIWGYGNYDITIFAETNEKIMRGKDITLELLQNFPIGTNIVEEIKKNRTNSSKF